MSSESITQTLPISINYNYNSKTDHQNQNAKCKCGDTNDETTLDIIVKTLRPYLISKSLEDNCDEHVSSSLPKTPVNTPVEPSEGFMNFLKWNVNKNDTPFPSKSK